VVLKAGTKVVDRLYIVIYVSILTPVGEVNVRGYEPTIRHQNSRYLLQFFILVLAHILEKALGHDDVEPVIVETDWVCHDIEFQKIRLAWRRCDINAVVINVRSQESHQRSGTTSNVEEIAVSWPR
jgi:hypothetical protein